MSKEGDKMKYALIGCGRIAANHIAAAKNNGLEIVGVCDLQLDKAKKLTADFDCEVEVFDEYRVMLSVKKPELVAIATESGEHASIAKECIAAGCNVIIEKPIALSLSDDEEIIALAEKHNVKVCACHQNRFNKSIYKIRQAVDEHKLGKMFYGVANIRWNRNEQYYEQAKWRGTWRQDGGALMNQCIHNIDLLRWMMGDEIEDVVAYTDQQNHPYLEAEDFGIAMVRFRNGSYGIIEGTTNVYPKNLEETLYLFGEKGTIKAGGKSVNQIEEWLVMDDEDLAENIKKEFSEIPPNVYGYGHTPLYKDMIDAITKDREPYVDGKAGRRALELVLAIYLAASKQEKITLPLDDCATLDFEGMFG